MTLAPPLLRCRRRYTPVLLGVFVLALPAAAAAASKALVAAVGDAAPGGGVFTGPGFSSWPTAAGSGWIAFRSQLVGGHAPEAIVVAHMTSPMSQATVASLNSPAPSGGIFGKCTGKLKQFIGQPVVNANGDVAFMALIDPPTDGSDTTDTVGPLPAGIFALRGGQLVPVACSGQSAAGGILDLVAVLDVLSDATTDVATRSPALNDAGDVAFLTGYVNTKGFPTGGAIVVAPRAGGYTEITRIGGTFQSLGPPALNNGGTVAFHGITTDPTQTGGLLDGVFAADASGVRLLVGSGAHAMPVECPLPPAGVNVQDQPLLEFQDAVALNDRGDVAFLASPFSDSANTPGVVLFSADTLAVTLLGYPEQKVCRPFDDNGAIVPCGPGSDFVTGVTLGPSGGSVIASPSIGPDGSAAFFVSLNGGSSEAIVNWNGKCVLPVAYTGGNGADEAPPGPPSTYAGAESAPALDATGGIAFLARISGGQSSEAIVYDRPSDGTIVPILLGEAAPQQNKGFFGGRPFSVAHLNDAGDVVFRAYVTRGPSNIGIFRLRDGKLAPVVRAGDPAPVPNGPPFLDFPGEPSVNAAGDVVFAAQLETRGRGIYLVDRTGVHAVVLKGDAVPGEPGAIFTGFGPNPQLNDAGAVAFSGTTEIHFAGNVQRHSGIFVKDASGIRTFALDDEPSPAGPPFLKFRDPAITNAPSVVFRAPLDVSAGQPSSGIFVADGTGTTALAMENQDLGGGVVLSGFGGNPVVTPGGLVAFLATRAQPIAPGDPPIRPLGPAVLARRAGGVLGLVAARDMSGPAGGTFKDFGPPAINASGHVIFRAGFNALTGGTSGLYVDDGATLRPYALGGEVSPLGGRLSVFRSQPSLNASDEVTFSADVVGGRASSGLFVASPTTLVARPVRLRLSGGKRHDRIAIRAVLSPGRVSDGVDPANEPVVVSLADAGGQLWSVTVPEKRLKGHRRSWAIVPPRASELARQLRALRLAVGKHGTVRLNVTSAAIDLTKSGLRELQPPLTVSVEVGDDAGSSLLACRLGKRGGRCGS